MPITRTRDIEIVDAWGNDDGGVTVAKNRHGEMGTISLLWQGQYARLQDKSYDPWGSTTLDI